MMVAMSANPALQATLDDAFADLAAARQTIGAQLLPQETGRISAVSTGVISVSGLPNVGYEELVKFPGELYGIAFNIEATSVDVILLGEAMALQTGDEVLRTHRVADVPVGEQLLGRVVNPLGTPMDDHGPLQCNERRSIECPAPGIMDRAPVSEPLQTGIKVVDALVPIGRGQRELILGDRQTGKTTIALDAIINQRDQNVICIYCAIGQRGTATAKAIARLREHDALAYSVVVVTEGNDAPGMQYIAPYAATSMAEYFMHQGRDVLIVYDDLTNHARAYRELSLLMHRPPGREAFPGDIFYIHSRLLERATHLCAALGGGSLTALPVVETEAQNLAAYIPTNLISITDGQLYLSPHLFELGVMPAVDVGKSVSRVGGKAQLPAYRAVAGALKLAYAQFEELESFARFGTRLDEATRHVLEHGRRIRACLQQGEFDLFTVPEQLLVLLALTADLFDAVPMESMQQAEMSVRTAARMLPEAILKRILDGGSLDDAARNSLVSNAREALTKLVADRS